jgi:hypothetical protein
MNPKTQEASMFRTASRTDRIKAGAAGLGAAAEERLEHLRQRTHDATHTVSHRADAVSNRTSDLAGRAGELAGRATEIAGHATERAADKTAELSERARPKVEAAQTAFFETVVPKMTAAMNTAAVGLAEAGEHAKEGAAPYVEQAKGSAHIGNERARYALKVLKGEATIVPRKRSHKGRWLLGLGLVAAALAAWAAFRPSRRADDPWATPLTDAAPAPSLAERVGHAKDAVGEAAHRARDKASELADRGQAAVADARDRTGELADPDLDAENDLEAAELAGDVPLDGPAEALDETDVAADEARSKEL